MIFLFAYAIFEDDDLNPPTCHEYPTTNTFTSLLFNYMQNQ